MPETVARYHHLRLITDPARAGAASDNDTRATTMDPTTLPTAEQANDIVTAYRE